MVRARLHTHPSGAPCTPRRSSWVCTSPVRPGRPALPGEGKSAETCAYRNSAIIKEASEQYPLLLNPLQSSGRPCPPPHARQPLRAFRAVSGASASKGPPSPMHAASPSQPERAVPRPCKPTTTPPATPNYNSKGGGRPARAGEETRSGGKRESSKSYASTEGQDYWWPRVFSRPPTPVGCGGSRGHPLTERLSHWGGPPPPGDTRGVVSQSRKHARPPWIKGFR
ncbi:hypothetical protein HRbin02_01351 [Candidatus Calditenuaceae archaeon HR02]|nr:hypothetical protein HRbin02_01351 [Candidatus Calditenuaceae archaeon HR02]